MKKWGLQFVFLIFLVIVIKSDEEFAIDGTPTAVNTSSQYEMDERTAQLMEREKLIIEKVEMQYSHIQTYSFELKEIEEFVVTVQTDHVIRAKISVHWEESDTYQKAYYNQGEEIRLIILQNRKQILNDFFFSQFAFTFNAKQGVRYVLRFSTKSIPKLVILDMENYLKSGKTSNSITSEHFNQHGAATEKVKQKLKTFLGIVERNTLMNEDMAWNVQLHINRFMTYQIIETIFVLCATISQVYFIKSLLTSTSMV